MGGFIVGRGTFPAGPGSCRDTPTGPVIRKDYADEREEQEYEKLFLFLLPVFDKITNIPILNLFPGPGGFPQKHQAGLNAWLTDKTLDLDLPAHFFPTILLKQPGQNHLQGNAMQGIIRLLTILTDIHTIMAFAPSSLPS